MSRTRRYIIMKETAYFPDDAFDNAQKKKAVMKYNLVNLLHPLFLLGVMLLLLWPMLTYPDRYEIVKKCNETKWNPSNKTWDVHAEERAWYPYLHWARAYDDVDQLKNFYNRTNATEMIDPITRDVVDYNISESVRPVVYETHDYSTIDAVKALVKPAMTKAYDDWSAEYKGLRDCAMEYIDEEDYHSTSRDMYLFVVLYSLIFLLSLCAREIFLHNMVKKEYTASEWKKESHNNMFWICALTFVSLLFLAYLFWVPDRRAAYLHGILSRYWTV